jgi:hypothetical protein
VLPGFRPGVDGMMLTSAFAQAGLDWLPAQFRYLRTAPVCVSGVGTARASPGPALATRTRVVDCSHAMDAAVRRDAMANRFRHPSKRFSPLIKEVGTSDRVASPALQSRVQHL